MPIINCPECARSVSDKAQSCPSCGYPLQAGVPGPSFRGAWGYYGYEYKSKKMIFGMPLVHIAYGPSPGGGLRVAKGFIAIGNVAVGVIAIGGVALGIFALAGVGIGLVCLAGVALGVILGMGGIATGYFALGGVAIGVYAIGGLSLGSHTIYNDPQLRKTIESLFHFRH
jgi:hypothetical protein